MKLYHTPGTCSLCPNIVLREAGVDFELQAVNLREKKLADGEDFFDVNFKGQVPTLELDDGTRLTECAAIVQYIADQNPGANLAPAAGTMDHYRLLEWLSYIGSEMHKTFPALFLPTTPEDYKPIALQRLTQKFENLDAHLADNDYLMGDSYTIADSYCFAIMNWHKRSDIDLAPWPNLKAYMERIAARPKVQEAMASEG